MVSPDEIAYAAKRKENKNYKFRVFLKNHANEQELDAQFLRLHNELFTDYDCSKCRNCCKLFHTEISVTDIEKSAEHLHLNTDEFIDTYLKQDEHGLYYITKHKPCDFLQEDGECMLGDCKPESCANYPYTNQPERLWSLFSFVQSVAVCPVAYEICERLKIAYNFK